AGETDTQTQERIDDRDDGGRLIVAEQDRHAQEADRGDQEPERQRNPRSVPGDQVRRWAGREEQEDPGREGDQRRVERTVSEDILGVLLTDEQGPEQATPRDGASDQRDRERPGSHALQVEERVLRPSLPHDEAQEREGGHDQESDDNAAESIVGQE